MYKLMRQNELVAESAKLIEYSTDMQAWQNGAVFHSDPQREMYVVDTDSVPLTIEQQIAVQTQKRLDDFARTKNYDGVLSACTYANSSVPKFSREGTYCMQMRDLTWATLDTIFQDIQSGARPPLSGYEDVEPLLPDLVWPTEP